MKLPQRTKKELLEEEKWLVSRKTGGEINVVLAYPNSYWVAMSSLAFQTIYRAFSSEERVTVERAFFNPDAPQDVRTFESSSRLAGVDILAVSISFELDYPNVLFLLEQAGLKFPVDSLASESRSSRPLLIAGGSAVTLNPEPLARFFDVIVIGEADELVGEIVNCYDEAKSENLSREELLVRLSNLDGVYVPCLFEPDYSPEGELVGYRAGQGGVKRAKRRVLKVLDDCPTHSIVCSANTEFKSMFLAETGRGCESGCRFCAAGYIYRPVRKRRTEHLREVVSAGLEVCSAIGLVGASVSSHPGIKQLVKEIVEAGGRPALSSVMSQQIDESFAELLGKSGVNSIALAPETGSEKLRYRMGKRVSDEQILKAAELLARQGLKNFKLYFMVGLPTESGEDVAAIPALVHRIARLAFSAARSVDAKVYPPQIVISLNAFIPKAWTPLQRHPFMDVSKLKQRLSLVKRECSKFPNVRVQYESLRESYFQALLSRADRRVGLLLEHMHVAKEDWRKLYSQRGKVIVEGVPEADYYVCRSYRPGEFMPWEVIDGGIDPSLLDREYERVFSAD